MSGARPAAAGSSGSPGVIAGPDLPPRSDSRESFAARPSWFGVAGEAVLGQGGTNPQLEKLAQIGRLSGRKPHCANTQHRRQLQRSPPGGSVYHFLRLQEIFRVGSITYSQRPPMRLRWCATRLVGQGFQFLPAGNHRPWCSGFRRPSLGSPSDAARSQNNAASSRHGGRKRNQRRLITASRTQYRETTSPPYCWGPTVPGSTGTPHGAAHPAPCGRTY